MIYMNSSLIILVFTALGAGTLIGWLIRKLTFEKNHIPAARYEALHEQHQRIRTEAALARQENENHRLEIAKQESRHAADQAQLDQLKTELAAARAGQQSLSDEKQVLLAEQHALQAKIEAKTKDEIAAAKQLSDLSSKLENQTHLYEQQKADLEHMSEKLRKDFSLLANTILDEKTQKFSDIQQKELNVLLDPLKTNLAEFKAQIERTYKTENEDRISLREQVKQMMGLNELLSREAQALTRALSGSTKKQGDWGEMILESILDYCGLQKGIHYFTQESREDGEGTRIRPDILVKYSGDRVIVIDSKVSLQHYEQLCREEDPDTQAVLIKRMLQSFYSHIDGLSAKKYTDVSGSLDMVIMFLPVEAAYITALQHDPELQQYAYRKNILLISPSNLTLAMKLVFDLWKRDGINKNAEAIAGQAGRLYDKLAAFVEHFERIGRAISGLQDAYGEAQKQLATGRGNVISRAEQMKQLQIKSAKEMPAKYLTEAGAADPLPE
jgi:DNA recombination protein RmuC